jgi:DNA-binding NarL/FixJ family response regulator
VLAGASGYILKQIHGPDLADAVRRVAAGESLLDPEAVAALSAPTAPPLNGRGDGPITELTPQEERVLDLIVEGLTNRQIGQRLNIAEKTVKNHVTSLMAKLHVERRTQAAVYGARVRGFGRRWS